MTGTDNGTARYALSENYRDGFAGRMIRTAKFKYFFYNNGEEYLYDMQSDPGEEVNLSKKPEFQQLGQELKAKAIVNWKKPGKKSTQESGAEEPLKPASKRAAQK
jgi:arylsulfatase A-like enzyme